jgi:hypothetical protein
MSFEVWETLGGSGDGQEWVCVDDDSVYMSAYRAAETHSRTSGTYVQVWRIWGLGEGCEVGQEQKEPTPMVCFHGGRLWSWDRDGYPRSTQVGRVHLPPSKSLQ